MTTTSLELSQQLKEAGYPQESHFWWFKQLGTEDTSDPAFGGYDEWVLVESAAIDEGYMAQDRAFASPTADEILEKLPSSIVNDYFWIEKKSWGYAVHLYPHGSPDSKHEEQGKTLADAAAKCWLYLKKEGLLEDNTTKGSNE